MNGHPGGEEHTLHMLELAGIPAGGRILDLGAGAGESLRLLQRLGYRAEGIDRPLTGAALMRAGLNLRALPGDYPALQIRLTAIPEN